MWRPVTSSFRTRYFSTSSKSLFFQRFLQPVIEASQKKEHIVKQLIKPIGLSRPPSTNVKYSKGNSFKDLFDEGKTRRRTKELSREMSQAGMYDMYTFRKYNGKLFWSPKSYWREDKALYFPHIVGKSIAKGHRKLVSIENKMKGKLNLVRIFGNDIGENLSREFLTPPEGMEEWQTETTQLIEISWTENSLKSLIMRLSLPKLRLTMSEQRQSHYFVCDRNQLPFTIRDELNINNLFTGYTLLVDRNLKIRWMACGGISPGGEDKVTLWKSVKALQTEMSGTPAKSSGV